MNQLHVKKTMRATVTNIYTLVSQKQAFKTEGIARLMLKQHRKYLATILSQGAL